MDRITRERDGHRLVTLALELTTALEEGLGALARDGESIAEDVAELADLVGAVAGPGVVARIVGAWATPGSGSPPKPTLAALGVRIEAIPALHPSVMRVAQLAHLVGEPYRDDLGRLRQRARYQAGTEDHSLVLAVLDPGRAYRVIAWHQGRDRKRRR